MELASALAHVDMAIILFSKYKPDFNKSLAFLKEILLLSSSLLGYFVRVIKPREE
jgi:hypothetical protein